MLTSSHFISCFHSANGDGTSGCGGGGGGGGGGSSSGGGGDIIYEILWKVQ